MARIIVVGAGAGGLAASARLATRRHDVLVLDAAPAAGGRLRPLDFGIPIDARVSVVPDIITMPAPLRDLFNKTGRALDDVIELKAAPATHVMLADGRVVVVPSVGPALVADALAHMGSSATAAAYLTLMKRAADLWQQLRQPLLETVGGDDTWLRQQFPRWSGRRLLAPHHSFEALTTTLDNTDAQALLDLEALDAGSLPHQLPAWAITRSYVRSLFGEWTMPGGNAALAQVLEDRARERGAQFEVATSVQQVAQVAGRVSGVECNDGRHFAADWVVVAGDSTLPTTDVEPAVAAEHLSTLVALVRIPHAAWRDDLAAADRIVVLPQQRRLALADLQRAGVPAHAWVRLDCVPDSEELWAVRIPVNAATAVTAGDATWLHALIERGVFGSVAQVVAQVGPAEVGQHLHAPGSRLHGPARTSARELVRPPVTSETPGLLRAGGSVVAGPGLPYAIQSAEVVADVIGRPARL